MHKKIGALLLTAALAMPALTGAVALSPDDSLPAEPDIVIARPATVETLATEKSDEALLEDAIKAAKRYLGNTDRFAEMSHKISDYGKVKIVNLSWSESKNEGEYLSAEVTDDGVLLWFRLSDQSEIGIPQISKADAVRLAYEFAMKVNPAYGLLSEEHATIGYYRWTGYIVTFHCLHEGRELDGKNVEVIVNPDGRVIGYDAYSFARGLQLPETPEATISDADAKKAFVANLPLELVYKAFYNYNYEDGITKATIKLVYQIPDDYSDKVIDAATGKVLTVKRENWIYYSEKLDQAADMALVGGSATAKVNLTPAEQKAVNLQAGLLTIEDVEARLRAVKEFGFDDSLKLEYSSLYSVKSVFSDKLSYRWSLSYSDKDGMTHLGADVDAKTGEVISFYGYSSNEDSVLRSDYKKPDEFKYSEAECEQAAIKLLQSLYGEKFGGYVKTDYMGVRPLEEDIISSYTFRFVRTINGAKFYNDMIYISVNPGTLGVTSLNFTYTDTTFPSAEGAIDVSAAVDKYFNVVALKPYYIVGYGVKDGELEVPAYDYSTEEKVLVPVYGYTYGGYVDAKTGSLLGYDGEPADYKPTTYFDSNAWFSDLAGSPYYKAIKTLYNMDVIDVDDKLFKPDDAVNADYFNAMIEKANYSYYVPEVKTGEETGTISLEDAMYSVVRALGYGVIADLNGIFKNPFGDGAKLSEDRVGAAAIIIGLNLFDGIALDEESPYLTASLTRGQAAQMVYNLLMLRYQKN